MNLDQFVNYQAFKYGLVDSKDTLKNKHFRTLIGGFMSNNPDILVRDFIDIDSTFGIVTEQVMTLSEGVELYLDVQFYLETTTYMKVVRTGLINLVDSKYNGFWVELK